MKLFQTIRMGVFLGFRELRRANIWTTFLIVTIMILTFLNLVVISGLLVGIIEGSVIANRTYYSSDIIVSAIRGKETILHSQEIIRFAKNHNDINAVSARYIASGTLEADYKDRRGDNSNPDQVGALLAGINVEDEHRVTGIDDRLIEGRFLRKDDFDKIVVGSALLFKYTPVDTPSESTLKKAELGGKVRLTINGKQREVEIVGILKTKAGEVDRRVYVPDTYLRTLLNRVDLNVNEIAIDVKDPARIQIIKNVLKSQGFEDYAVIQDWDESLPKFLNDIKVTFNLLGVIVGAIGVAVASITIFIVIFINAISRRRSIGILKGIGIQAFVIEVSYVFQAVFYSLIGSAIGLIILYYGLVPFFQRNPIDFPFSEGILAVTTIGVLIRLAVIFIVTILAGYIPAKIITRQNTLNSILGR